MLGAPREGRGAGRRRPNEGGRERLRELPPATRRRGRYRAGDGRRPTYARAPLALAGPGHDLPATIDRANPSNVRIEWDEVPDARARARQRAERNATPEKAGRRRPRNRPKDRFDDRMRRLEKLARLHAAGELTDAEFAEQKRKLFGR